MLDSSRQSLIEAAERNATIVLSLPSAGILRHHKSRLLALTGEALWVESVPSESLLLDELVATANPAGVAFKSGDTKIIFFASIRARELGYRLSHDTTVEALRMDLPQDLKKVQRRAHYRAKIASSDVCVRVWRIAAAADLARQPMAAQELQTDVRDISLGGMGVIFHSGQNGPPKVAVDERLRVQIRRDSSVLLLEGRVRCLPQRIGDSLRCGIQWTGMQESLEGRRRLTELTKFIGVLEREELRRTRLGAA